MQQEVLNAQNGRASAIKMEDVCCGRSGTHDSGSVPFVIPKEAGVMITAVRIRLCAGPGPHALRASKSTSQPAERRRFYQGASSSRSQTSPMRH